jgi:hypothetical protein
MNTYELFRTELETSQYIDADSPIIEALIEFRWKLLDMSYENIPIRGKGGTPEDRTAINKLWTSGPITRERIEMETRFGTAKLNTGLRTGQLVGIDNDLKNPEHAAILSEMVDELLGPTPLHRRGSKGEMACYYNATPIPKILIANEDGAHSLFEILGSGNQFAGYGRHPAGIWYEWAGLDPSQVPLRDLPHVTPDQLNDLVEQIRAKLIELGYQPKPKPVYVEKTEVRS